MDGRADGHILLDGPYVFYGLTTVLSEVRESHLDCSAFSFSTYKREK